MHKQTLFVTAFSLIILAALLNGCGGGVSHVGIVEGTIVNTDYNHISGITVSIGNIIGSTASNGIFTLTSVPQGSGRISIGGRNYIPRYHEVNVVKGQRIYVPLTILAPFDTKTTWIEGGGGTVTNTDGSLTLTLPSGALVGSTAIILTNVPLVATPAPSPFGYKIISLVYISPDTTLNAPATLSVPHNAGLSDGASVPFLHFDTATLSWKSMSTGNVSTSTNTITVQISAFGWVAGITEIDPLPGSITGKVLQTSSLDPIANANVWMAWGVALTDSSGSYTLTNIPTGQITVYAEKSGYTRNSVAVTVISNTTVTAPPLNLTPKLTGTIQGRVISATTALGIQDARVVAEGTYEAYTDSRGYYTLYEMSTGEVDLRAFASGYTSISRTVTVVVGETTTADFSLSPVTPSPTSFTDDFETDTGDWSTTGTLTGEVSWHRTNGYGIGGQIKNTLHPEFVNLPGDVYLPSAHSGSYAYWYGGNATGSYIGVQESSDSSGSGGTSEMPHCGALTSKAIDMSGFAYATLSFWTWWEIESINPATGYDHIKIQVSTNDGYTWEDIGILNPRGDPDAASKQACLPYTSGGFNQAGIWVKHSFDLTSYVGSSKVRVRFFFDTEDDKYNGFRGWFIDDVEISPRVIVSSSISSASLDLRPPLIFKPR